MRTRTNRTTRRSLAAVAVVALWAAALTPATPAAAQGATGERIGGANRYDTAALIAPHIRRDCRAAVANGRNFPDGLAGAALSLKLLLTEVDVLPAETVAELELIDELCPEPFVRVLGGTAAVSPAVFNQLRSYVEQDSHIVRLGGANRYQTALAIAELRARTGGDPNRVADDTVLLTTGANFPDALAAGPVAVDRKYPILLNDGDALRADVAAFLAAKSVQNVFILGGPAAVPVAIDDQLRALGIKVERLAGADRYGTAAAIADRFGPTTQCALLVNGTAFPDALAAGPLGGNRRSLSERCPIVLVDRDSVPQATRDWLVANLPQWITAIGGTGVVSDRVLAEAMSPDNPPATITSATVVNTNTSKALFRIAGDALTVTADAGSAADGPFGNTWSISFVDDPNPASAGVAVDEEATAFTMTAGFSAGLSYAGFVDIWNASPAAQLTTARTTTPAATFGTPPEDHETPMGLGAADSTLTLTFDRAIVDPTPFTTGQAQVFADGSGDAPLVVDLARARTEAFDAVSGTKVSFQWLRTVDLVARPGNQLRVTVGKLTTSTGQASPQLTVPITPP